LHRYSKGSDPYCTSGTTAGIRTFTYPQKVMLRVNRTDSGSTGLKWTS